MAGTMDTESILDRRKVSHRIDNDYKRWSRNCTIFEYLNFIFGAGSAILSTLVAGTVAVGGKTGNFDFHTTAYAAAAAALCTYANTVFNFGKRAEKHHSAKTDLRQAIVKYESDPNLAEAWLGEAYAKAAERLR
jgi:hypothetical protein